MKAVTLVFPHQLFKSNPAVHTSRPVYLVEEWLFFRQYNFHRQKLIFHRASMKTYEQYLSNSQTIHYVDTNDPNSDIRLLIAYLHENKITEIHYTDTVDNWLEKRISTASKRYGISAMKYPSPSFLNTMDDVNDFFEERQAYFQTDFYTWQRQQRKILLENDGKPLGGKWSFDADNRKKFPKKAMAPIIDFPEEDGFVAEAKQYINKHFPDNYGQGDSFPYPVNYATASQWLTNFLETRFAGFGTYEDAMSEQHPILFHSVLTPMLNTGILQPLEVIDKAIETAIQYEIPLNSLEGFIRQIMGWREFIRIVYEREGSRQRTTNYWKFSRKIPPSFWTGETGIYPVDAVIKKLLKSGYCHHIERLMVLGNFMVLCEFDPDDVYQWFMELFIDSYDWVMVPNVYGMTQFADGGLMTTKPYISGSNYLMKMSDWPKGSWQETWDALFWRFMHVHRDFFSKNPRLGMLLSTWDKMEKTKQQKHLLTAENFLQQLDRSAS